MTRYTTRRLAPLAAALLSVLVASPAVAGHVRMDAALGHGHLMADSRETAYLRVALQGRVPDRRQKRVPLNVALVIDRSGSMAGEKLAAAKQAALVALQQLQPDDVVSLVAYDTTVQVLVPATRATHPERIRRAIEDLEADGQTALFAATVKAADEVRRFRRRGYINRIVLLSDGQANVGPSTPTELGELGASLRSEGIAVTTVGLGLSYNEDLMVALARRSGATFVHAGRPQELARLYREGFGSLASIVGKDVHVEIEFAEGFRPQRSLGMESEIVGQTVSVRLAQVYGGTEEDVVIELKTPPLPPRLQPVATVRLRYFDVVQQSTLSEQAEVDAQVTASRVEHTDSINRPVMIAVVERLGDEQSQVAIRLRDEGRVEEARKVMEGNGKFLQRESRRLGSQRLERLGVDNDEDSRSLEGDRWRARRKAMRRRSMELGSAGLF